MCLECGYGRFESVIMTVQECSRVWLVLECIIKVLDCVIKVHECGWFLSALLRFMSVVGS